MANLFDLQQQMNQLDTLALFDEAITESEGVIIETNVKQLEEEG